MSAIDRLFQLRMTPPFDRLSTAELTVIAEVARPFAAAPGETVLWAREDVRCLHLVREGALVLGGAALPPVVGAAAMLFERMPIRNVVADPVRGAAGLTIGRSHFFTIVNECPALLVEFFRSAGALVGTEI